MFSDSKVVRLAGSGDATSALTSRAERFGAVSEDARKALRAQKFGVVAEGDKKQQRAARFGGSTAAAAPAAPAADDETKAKRAARFGIEITAPSSNGDVTNGAAATGAGGSDADKKAQRATRFGLSNDSKSTTTPAKVSFLHCLHHLLVIPVNPKHKSCF